MRPDSDVYGGDALGVPHQLGQIRAKLARRNAGFLSDRRQLFAVNLAHSRLPSRDRDTGYAKLVRKLFLGQPPLVAVSLENSEGYIRHAPQ